MRFHFHQSLEHTEIGHKAHHKNKSDKANR